MSRSLKGASLAPGKSTGAWQPPGKGRVRLERGRVGFAADNFAADNDVLVAVAFSGRANSLAWRPSSICC